MFLNKTAAGVGWRKKNFLIKKKIRKRRPVHGYTFYMAETPLDPLVLVSPLSTLSNGFLPGDAAFQAWKDPEDILWDDLGLLKSSSRLQDQWAKFKTMINFLLDHVITTPTSTQSSWVLWWSVTACPSRFTLHPQHLLNAQGGWPLRVESAWLLWLLVQFS